jgi:hypothetical protein
MKGFMTVRKWIDRSIAGLETRSGDYPVVNTKNVAIIVMLSGLENIPRITELHEIRSQSKPKKRADPEVSSDGLPEKDQKTVRDDMITLPVRRARADDSGRRTPARDAPEVHGTFVPTREPVPQKEMPVDAEERTPPVAVEASRQAQPHKAEPVPRPAEGEDSRIPEALAPSRRRVIVTHAEKDHAYLPASRSPSVHGSQRTGHMTGVSDHTPQETPVRYPEDEIPRSKETERQRIERELRRQRTVAMGQNPQKNSQHAEKRHPPAQESHLVQRSPPQDRTSAKNQTPVQGNETNALSGEKRTVIIGKRKVTAVPQEEPEHSVAQEKTRDAYPDESLSEDDGMSVQIKDRVFQARDEVFQGKGIRKPTQPQARDSTLLHTELKPKKRASDQDDADNDKYRADLAGKDSVSIKKRTKSEERT